MGFLGFEFASNSPTDFFVITALIFTALRILVRQNP